MKLVEMKENAVNETVGRGNIDAAAVCEMYGSIFCKIT